MPSEQHSDSAISFLHYFDRHTRGFVYGKNNSLRHGIDNLDKKKHSLGLKRAHKLFAKRQAKLGTDLSTLKALFDSGKF